MAPQILGATWRQSTSTIGEKPTKTRPDQSVITDVQKGKATGLLIKLLSIFERVDSSVCTRSLGTNSQVCLRVNIPTRHDAEADSALSDRSIVRSISDDWSPIS
jgi:hypothetical protein